MTSWAASQEQMMPITNCTKCGKLYEDQSEESANDPERLCYPCFEADDGKERTDECETQYACLEPYGARYDAEHW